MCVCVHIIASVCREGFYKMEIVEHSSDMKRPHVKTLDKENNEIIQ